ncbi:MAG TPA: hypothetical protein VHA13_01335 [Gammaproteobacteria bacterium]|nr:hypothetical protein [Gammaproteobacteria bacterium]
MANTELQNAFSSKLPENDYSLLVAVFIMQEYQNGHEQGALHEQINKLIDVKRSELNKELTDLYHFNLKKDGEKKIFNDAIFVAFLIALDDKARQFIFNRMMALEKWFCEFCDRHRIKSKDTNERIFEIATKFELVSSPSAIKAYKQTVMDLKYKIENYTSHLKEELSQVRNLITSYEHTIRDFRQEAATDILRIYSNLESHLKNAKYEDPELKASISAVVDAAKKLLVTQDKAGTEKLLGLIIKNNELLNRLPPDLAAELKLADEFRNVQYSSEVLLKAAIALENEKSAWINYENGMLQYIKNVEKRSDDLQKEIRNPQGDAKLIYSVANEIRDVGQQLDHSFSGLSRDGKNTEALLREVKSVKPILSGKIDLLSEVRSNVENQHSEARKSNNVITDIKEIGLDQRVEENKEEVISVEKKLGAIKEKAVAVEEKSVAVEEKAVAEEKENKASQSQEISDSKYIDEDPEGSLEEDLEDSQPGLPTDLEDAEPGSNQDLEDSEPGSAPRFGF